MPDGAVQIDRNVVRATMLVYFLKSEHCINESAATMHCSLALPLRLSPSEYCVPHFKPGNWL